ncbi:DUF3823 domain-containing protein [Parabacteroides sp. PF5-6]|uniref:DUF3823 domain-containing protein n=1 Tax=Parabacteroides sp. PF5-6 TaxID=1742403 RepID=UPI002405333F|nr:DUF3823 domain-containing protein [Parabacteroides sp. PF5-6]MDF9831710.1 hypothetical protein [Parabacteroides sp. PF5-6]
MKKMKIISRIIPVVMLLAILSSCGFDNFDAPTSTLVGKVTYNGSPLNVRGTGEAIRLQLFQDGFDKRDAIELFVGQDGAFSAKLFDGQYKMVTRDGNGPWVNSRDTTIVNVKGTTEVSLDVTPYFLISGENISVSGSTMNASFTVNQIVSTAGIDRAMLILSKTQFADDVNNIFRQDFSDVSAGSVSLSADISGNNDVANAKALYGRVGVYAKGADQAIYSPVVKLK